jgi:hypothetical protein
MDTHDNTSYPTGKREGDGEGDGKREGDGKETRKETRKEKGKLYSSYVSAGAEEKEDSGAAAATENKKFLFKKLNGDLGQGVVNLTEHQIERLLDQLGLEMFDYYVKKLSDFILSNNASVKNHYATILRWWMEDQSL